MKSLEEFEKKFMKLYDSYEETNLWLYNLMHNKRLSKTFREYLSLFNNINYECEIALLAAEMGDIRLAASKLELVSRAIYASPSIWMESLSKKEMERFNKNGLQPHQEVLCILMLEKYMATFVKFKEILEEHNLSMRRN